MSNLLSSVEDCVDQAIEQIGRTIVLGAPLGLGKPVQLINAFYQRAAADPTLSLHILTALCLEKPRANSFLEERLTGPILERLFGDYEDFDFLAAQRTATLPDNVKVSEVYVKPGAMKNVRSSQQNYISSNYTHIARDMLGAGMNVLAQMVAAKEEGGDLKISLSCNPDVTLELIDSVADLRRPLLMLAQVHDDLPFMPHDAEIPVSTFDFIVCNTDYNHTLFGIPNAPVPLLDYATAIHASSLIVDGGTLQIGIGALGDAVAYACILRQRDNRQYRELLDRISVQTNELATDTDAFEQGLYVSTEMFVNGLMHLIEEGIVSRPVYDHLGLQMGINSGEITDEVDAHMYRLGRRQGFIAQHLDTSTLSVLREWGIVPMGLALQNGKLVLGGRSLLNDLDNEETLEALLNAMSGARLNNGCILHGGFFLGPNDFYKKLAELDDTTLQKICMTGVRRTNQLLLDYPLYSAQRINARFINTGMIASISGAVASDALEDGTVISGVGGQYNFVAMAHDLPGARSILCIRSTRGQGKQLRSNIVTHYGHTTIPRHLRDVVVTEYGVADLRGQSDSEVIKRMINIADSRFQEELLSYAQRHGKVAADYSIPASARSNTPARLAALIQPKIDSGVLPMYPFGTELTEDEIVLAACLRKVKMLTENPFQLLKAASAALFHRADRDLARPYLERLGLNQPRSFRDRIIAKLLLVELHERGLVGAA